MAISGKGGNGRFQLVQRELPAICGLIASIKI